MKSNISELCLVARVSRTQPSATCNSTRSLSGIRRHYGEQGWEMEETKRQSCSQVGERCTSEEARVVRNKLTWMAYFPPEARMMPGLGYCQGKSSFKTRSQPRGLCWLISMAPIANEGHAEVSSLCYPLGPWWCLRTLLPQGQCTATWGTGDIWAPAAVEDHVWVHGTATTKVCVNVQLTMLPPKSTWCLWSKPHSLWPWHSRGYVATRTILIWEACTVTRATVTSRPELLFWGPCLGPWLCSRWGF